MIANEKTLQKRPNDKARFYPQFLHKKMPIPSQECDSCYPFV